MRSKSKMVSEYAFDALAPFAEAIASVLDVDEDEADVLSNLVSTWVTSIARLCIGLRQHGTGGAFLLTPEPIEDVLQVGHPFAYPRLKDAAILHVLDEMYSSEVERAQRAFTDKTEPVPADLAIEASLAETDAEDRRREMTGAVKLVTSLAAVDGLVLMTPALSVAGFGVKIGSTPNVATVYDGAGFAHRGPRARKIDPSQFGTRHGSMLRYCAQDRKALGIVVSQDGYVRLIMTVKNSLVFWDNLKLLNHRDFSAQAALREKRRRESRNRLRMPSRLGYTDTPKTIDRLMKAAASERKEKSGAQSATKLRSARLPIRSRRKTANKRPK